MYSHSHNKRMLPRKDDGYRADFPSHYYSSSSVYSYSPTSTSDCPEHGRSRRRTTLILTTSIVLATLGVLSIAGVAAYLGILSKNINNNASQFEESYLQSNTSKGGAASEEGDFLFNNGRSRSDYSGSSSNEGQIDQTNSLLDTKTGLEDDGEEFRAGITVLSSPTTRKPPASIIVQRHNNLTTTTSTKSFAKISSSVPPPVTITSDNSKHILVQKPPMPKPSVPSPVQVSSDPNMKYISDSYLSTPQSTKVYTAPPVRPAKTPSPPDETEDLEEDKQERRRLTNAHSLFPSTTSHTQSNQAMLRSSTHSVIVSTASVLNVDRDHDIGSENGNDRETQTSSSRIKEGEDKTEEMSEDDTHQQPSRNPITEFTPQNSFANREGLVASGDEDEERHVEKAGDHQGAYPHHKSDYTISTSITIPNDANNNNNDKKHFLISRPHSSDYFIPINPIISSERDDDPSSLLNNHKMHLTFDRISPEFYDKKPWTPLLNRPNLDKRPRVEVVNSPTPTIVWNSEEVLSSSSPSPSETQTYWGYGHSAPGLMNNLNKEQHTADIPNAPIQYGLSTDVPPVATTNDNDKSKSTSTSSSVVVTPVQESSEVLITSGGFKPVQIPAYTVLIPHIPNGHHNKTENSAQKSEKVIKIDEKVTEDLKSNEGETTSTAAPNTLRTETKSTTTFATPPVTNAGEASSISTNVSGDPHVNGVTPVSKVKDGGVSADDIKDEDYTDNDDVFGVNQPQTKIYKLDPESVDIVPDTLGNVKYPLISNLNKNIPNMDTNLEEEKSTPEINFETTTAGDSTPSLLDQQRPKPHFSLNRNPEEENAQRKPLQSHLENDTRQNKADISEEKALNSSVIAVLVALKNNSSNKLPLKTPVEADVLMKTTTDLIMSTLGSLNLVKSSSAVPNDADSRLRASDSVPEEQLTEAPLFPPVRSYVGINQPLRPKPYEKSGLDDADIIGVGEDGSSKDNYRHDFAELPPDITATTSLNKVLSMMMKFDEGEQRGHFRGTPILNITKQNVHLVVAGGNPEEHLDDSKSTDLIPGRIPTAHGNSSREQKSFNRDSKIDTQFNPPTVTSHIPVPLLTENSTPLKTKLSSVRVNSNSPVYKFVLRKGQSVEDLLKEIFNNYTNSSETTTTPSKIGIINELTPSNSFFTTFPTTELEETTTTQPEKISSVTDLKFQFSNAVTTSEPEVKTSTSVIVNENVHECVSNNSFQCVSTKRCISGFARCNGLRDCEDNSDEKGCLCVDLLKAQMLHRKICDGIPDCKDFSDENQCEWCTPGQYICSGSRACVPREKICDGQRDCPRGDDESECVKIGESGMKDDLEDLSPTYHRSGHLMVRKKGVWGKLCVETFSTVVSHWEVKDLARAVCKALTFSDFETVERTQDEDDSSEPYYELFYGSSSNGSGESGESYSSSESSPRSGLGFKQTACKSKLVVKVTCQDLQCGTAPRAFTQAARYTRIVGGSNAGIGEWPWQAALYRDGEYQCGATLISSRWLLSAGHCFFHSQDDYWVARLGTLRRGATVLSPFEQVVRITHIFLHPQYKDVGFVNDISLLRLEKEVNFTDFVRPVCLPSRDTKIRDGRLCTVVGWGQLFEVGRVFPDTLQEVQLPLISTPECRKRTLFLPLYKLTEDMFCAGFDRGGRDACLGDSGGGMMCGEGDGRWSLYGVTSNGYGCARANRPGVYTKVASYLDWIYEKMRLDSSFTFRDKTPPCLGHRCPLGECLEPKRLCNGFSDCLDSSDERNCTWS